jgi:hypothetical protein
MLVGGEHPLVLNGMARDLMTSPTGHTVVGQANVSACLDDAARLVALDTTSEPESSGTVSSLLGMAVAGGFRDAVRQAFPGDVANGTPLALLRDDLPVAALISGYARLYEGSIPADRAKQSMKSDICSGWRSEGTMMTSVQAGDGVPVTLGPRAPAVADDTAADADGWHVIGPLPVGAMRRRRLVDVHVGGDLWHVTAMFRDTHVGPDGIETVLHEYSLTAAIDAATHVFASCAAVPRVLPWVECPVAASSADRLVGQPVESVREFVRTSLRGTTTCTHLNDLLRSLGDVAILVRQLHNDASGQPQNAT